MTEQAPDHNQQLAEQMEEILLSGPWSQDWADLQERNNCE